MTDAQILGLLLLGTGLFIGLIVAVSARRQRWLVENGVRTTGLVLDTRYRSIGEYGGESQSQVEFTSQDGTTWERWLTGSYSGTVEVAYHPKRPKRALIVEEVQARRGRVSVKVAIAGLAIFAIAMVGSGALLATGVWSPRIGKPNMAAICRGSGSTQHAAYGQGPGPHLVVSVDMASEEVVDIGLADGLGWGAQDPWDAELVLCLDRVAETFVENCSYGERVVSLYDSEYELTLREAQSGRVLDTDTWQASVDMDCPLVVVFSGSDPNPKPHHSTELVGIASLLRTYVER